MDSYQILVLLLYYLGNLWLGQKLMYCNFYIREFQICTPVQGLLVRPGKQIIANEKNISKGTNSCQQYTKSSLRSSDCLSLLKSLAAPLPYLALLIDAECFPSLCSGNDNWTHKPARVAWQGKSSPPTLFSEIQQTDTKNWLIWRQCNKHRFASFSLFSHDPCLQKPRFFPQQNKSKIGKKWTGRRKSK